MMMFQVILQMDKNDLTQKRARFILEQAWGSSTAHQGWKQGFLAVLDLLDEFAVHLIQQKWPLVHQFSPMCIC